MRLVFVDTFIFVLRFWWFGCVVYSPSLRLDSIGIGRYTAVLVAGSGCLRLSLGVCPIAGQAAVATRVPLPVNGTQEGQRSFLADYISTYYTLLWGRAHSG